MRIDIIEPYGFCVGVNNAVNRILEIARNEHGNIFCVNQLVHNKSVMKTIEKNGIIVKNGDKEKIVDSIDNGVLIFSAHGTDEKIIDKAKRKGLKVYNLVCPYVLKEFNIIKEKIKNGYSIIYIGIRNHEESQAATSLSSNIYFIQDVADIEMINIENDKIAIINQTTLSMSSLKTIHEKLLQKYPTAEIIDELCDSTRLRQDKSVSIASQYDLVIVVGDENSNNAKSLVEMIKKENTNVMMISSTSEVKSNDFINKEKIMICSSASSPRQDVESICKEIKKKMKQKE